MYTRALPYVVLLGLVWGTNIVASRYGIGEFEPYHFIALRLAIATLFLAPFLFWNGRGRRIERDVWLFATISGVLGVAIPMTTFVLSLQYLSSGVASIFVSMTPALIVLAAHFFLPSERMTTQTGSGVLLALVGSIFLIVRGESGIAGVGAADPLGFALILSGLLCETANTIMVRRRMAHMDTTTVTGIRLTVGAVLVVLLVLAIERPSSGAISAAGYFSLGYAAVVGALGGQFLAFYLMRHHGATAFSLTLYVVPVVATGFGILLLGEVVTWGMVVGVLLIASGIYLINRRTKVVAPLVGTGSQVSDLEASQSRSTGRRRRAMPLADD